MPGSKTKQIKDEDQYEALRRKGESKEKAARIANTKQKNTKQNSQKYEDRSRDELYQKAKEVGIEGRSKMSKKELISALRNH